MLNPIIAHATQTLHNYFNANEINQVARKAKFVMRRSKLDGFIFLKILVLGFLQYPQASLNQLSQISQDFGVDISPQGIDERLNQAAVTFLRDRLSEALTKFRAKRRTVATALESFAEVYFQDSTIQALPEGLQTLFPGSGGNASPAAVKIQLLFAFLSGNVEYMEFGAGRAPDSSYQAHISHLLPGSLLIQDLGFFNLAVLQTVMDRAAFFLSRWRQDVQVFLSQTPELPLDMLAFLGRQTAEVADYQVNIGLKARLSCRMICVRLPEKVAAQRRRRLKADAKRRGTLLPQRSLALCDWNVFLTNVPENKLSLPQILACYALRWQIELLFKLWKSQAALKHIPALRPERVLCEIYAKMIGLLITHFLTAPLRFLLLQQQIEISPPKARQILQNRTKDLSRVIGWDLHLLQDEIDLLFHRILRFARKNKRKMKPASLERFESAIHLHISQLYPLA
jgi:hypothetical protein